MNDIPQFVGLFLMALLPIGMLFLVPLMILKLFRPKQADKLLKWMREL